MTGGEREVVKLSLGEGRPTLNVLPVGLEGETMTLVCPFPVLPIEVPVSVTLPGREEEGPVRAVIRRVGVELMGESSIPRFKLQLVLDARGAGEAIEIPIEFDDREDDLAEGALEEAAAGAAAEDVDEAVSSSSEEEPKLSEPFESSERFEPSVIVEDQSSWSLDEEEREDSEGAGGGAPEGEMSWSVGDFFGSDGATEDDATGWDESDTLETTLDDDPPWAGAGDGAVVHADLSEPRRRSRWPVRVGVSLSLIVSILAVGYVMREQVMELVSPLIGEELTLAVLGLTSQPAASATEIEPAPVEAESGREEPAPLATSAAGGDEAVGDEEAAPAPVDEEGAALEGEEEEDIEAAEDAQPGEEATTASAARDDVDMEGSIQLANNAAASASPDPTVEEDPENLRVVLPTQWPVTEASSYRLHDPTGIVIDIPGGIAGERARWIDTAHDRVRSVRVLERENGVRFIIYLNDEFVPRYRVGYNRAGVTVDILGPDSRHEQATK
jgi:hypothetical protein